MGKLKLRKRKRVEEESEEDEKDKSYKPDSDGEEEGENDNENNENENKKMDLTVDNQMSQFSSSIFDSENFLKQNPRNDNDKSQHNKIRKLMSDAEPAFLNPSIALRNRKICLDLRALLADEEKDFNWGLLRPCKLPFIHTNYSFTSPSGAILRLKEFQVYGINWMISRFNNQHRGALLGDEMGLGKTIQTLFFLQQHISFYPGSKYLVIAPLSVLKQWEMESSKWTPKLKTISFYNEGIDLSILEDEKKLSTWDILVTNYETIILLPKRKRDIWRKLKDMVFECVIYDEAHKLKTKTSKTRIKCEELEKNFSILLTGTPMSMGIDEVHSLLTLFEDEKVIGSETFFTERYSTKMSIPKKTRRRKSSKKRKTQKKVSALEVSISREQQILFQKEILNNFILMRKIENVLTKDEIPEKVEYTIESELETVQMLLYRSFIERNLKFIRQLTATDIKSVFEIVQRLYDICDHPFIVKNGEEFCSLHQEKSLKRNLTPEEKEELLVTSSSKMCQLDVILKDIVAKGEKCLIFTRRRKFLYILEDYCDHRKFGYCLLHGGIPKLEREKTIGEFRTDPSKVVFLISTTAGNLGLNLAEANHVVIYNQSFNPFQDSQALSRAHRIGQKKVVRVYKMVTLNTVEKFVNERSQVRVQLEKTLFDTNNAVISKDDEKELAQEAILHCLMQFNNTSEDEIINEEDKKVKEEKEEKEKKDVSKALLKEMEKAQKIAQRGDITEKENNVEKNNEKNEKKTRTNEDNLKRLKNILSGKKESQSEENSKNRNQNTNVSNNNNILSLNNNRSNMTISGEDSSLGKVSLTDEDFWKKLFPDYVDADMLTSEYNRMKLNGIKFSKEKGEKFLKDFEKVLKETTKIRAVKEEDPFRLNMMNDNLNENSVNFDIVLKEKNKLLRLCMDMMKDHKSSDDCVLFKDNFMEDNKKIEDFYEILSKKEKRYSKRKHGEEEGDDEEKKEEQEDDNEGKDNKKRRQRITEKEELDDLKGKVSDSNSSEDSSEEETSDDEENKEKKEKKKKKEEKDKEDEDKEKKKESDDDIIILGEKKKKKKESSSDEDSSESEESESEEDDDDEEEEKEDDEEDDDNDKSFKLNKHDDDEDDNMEDLDLEEEEAQEDAQKPHNLFYTTISSKWN